MGLALGLSVFCGVQASAAGGVVPLSAVVQGQSVPALYPNLPTRLLGGPLGLTLGVRGIDTADNSKVGAVLLLSNKWPLSPSDMTTLNQLVGNLATQCFNLNPERLINISDWLIKRNALSLSTPQTARFGPLEVTYRPWQYTTVQRVASVVLSRSGVAGEEPWTSSCSL